jgi:hypothetical protein
VRPTQLAHQDRRVLAPRGKYEVDDTCPGLQAGRF